MAIAMLATGLIVTSVDHKKAATLEAVAVRLEESIKGRAKVLRTWLDGHILSSRRLTQSGLVRLFIADMADTVIGSPLPPSLRDQHPYFQTLMTDFASQNDLARATVIDRTGRLLISSAGPSINVPDILEKIATASADWTDLLLPIRRPDGHANQFVVDLLIPILNVQTAGDGTDGSAGILVQTLRVDRALLELLHVSPARGQSETIYLTQNSNDGIERFSLGSPEGEIIRLTGNARHSPGEPGAFRQETVDERPQFMLTKPVEGLDWTISHAVDAEVALLPVRHFALAATGIGIVVILVSSFSFAMVWSQRVAAHHQDLITLYRSLAERLDKQRQFLGAITTSISDWLSVKDQEDRIVFVNPACAEALGLPEMEVLGQRQEDLLRLKPFSPEEEMFGEPSSSNELRALDVSGETRVVSTATSDLRDETGQSIGMVTVLRDQTDTVERRRQKARALIEIIGAFVQAIEQRDSFLVGHTRRLRTYAIAVGRKLELDERTLSGLVIAASLSQIGKIFVPDQILTKPARHDQEESDIMRSHIDHAIRILGHIDFGFPVVEALSQMHERLDGCGYPSGLVEDEIELPGRILGACDVFCARTAPRTYRDRLSAGKTLYHLANNTSRYDRRVIAALAEVVSERSDGSSDNHLDRGFLDSSIWINAEDKQDSHAADAA